MRCWMVAVRSASTCSALSVFDGRPDWPACPRPAGGICYRNGFDYRGTTMIGQRTPGARLIRASAVTREQSRDSARAT